VTSVLSASNTNINCCPGALPVVCLSASSVPVPQCSRFHLHPLMIGGEMKGQSASFFSLGCWLLHHIQAGPGIIKLEFQCSITTMWTEYQWLWYKTAESVIWSNTVPNLYCCSKASICYLFVRHHIASKLRIAGKLCVISHSNVIIIVDYTREHHLFTPHYTYKIIYKYGTSNHTSPTSSVTSLFRIFWSLSSSEVNFGYVWSSS
jgi:hypothetical protein